MAQRTLTRLYDMGQHATRDRGEAGEEQVERADVLVLGAEQPALHEAELGVLVGAVGVVAG